MWARLRQLLACGPRLAAMAVLIAAMIIAPARLPAEPEDCCCPSPAECKCPEHQPGEPGEASIRRCSTPELHAATAPVPAAELPPAFVVVAPAVTVALPVTTLPA